MKKSEESLAIRSGHRPPRSDLETFVIDVERENPISETALDSAAGVTRRSIALVGEDHRHPTVRTIRPEGDGIKTVITSREEPSGLGLRRGQDRQIRHRGLRVIREQEQEQQQRGRAAAKDGQSHQ